VKNLGIKDILRIVITLIITFLVGVFVAPVAIWVFILALCVLIYTLALEIAKYYIGIKNLKKKSFEPAILDEL